MHIDQIFLLNKKNNVTKLPAFLRRAVRRFVGSAADSRNGGAVSLSSLSHKPNNTKEIQNHPVAARHRHVAPPSLKQGGEFLSASKILCKRIWKTKS